MDRKLKLELVQRSLGLRHKLKVHDSMKQPETHEEMAVMFLSKWEFEDELKAIEEILMDERNQNVSQKKAQLIKHGVVKESAKEKLPKVAGGYEGLPVDDAEEEDSGPSRPAKKKGR